MARRLAMTKSKKHFGLWSPVYMMDVQLIINETDTRSLALIEMYENYKETKKSFEDKMELYHQINEIFTELFYGCKTFWTGSSVSGCATKDSDFDLVICLDSAPNSRDEILSMLGKVSDKLSAIGEIENINVVKAKVPIATFIFQKVNFDVGIQNVELVYNTFILHTYLKIDPRVRVVITLVKRWMKSHTEEKRRSISSFGLCMLLIRYCQVGIVPNILPVIHEHYPEFFTHLSVHNMNLSTDSLGFQSPNTMSIAEIFSGFISFYSNFDYSNVIDITSSTTIKKSAKIMEYGPENWTYLAIVDPSRDSNVAASIRKKRDFDEFLHKFKECNGLIHKGTNLVNLF